MVKIWIDRIVKWIDGVVVKSFDIAVNKLLDVLGSLIDAIKNQFSTAKGAVWFILGVLVVLDIFLGGKTGVIAFILTQFKDILAIVIDAVKSAGWQLIILILLVYLIITKK